MRIHKCWFCSANIYPGHGVTFVRNDSNVFRFCRSKCHKLFRRRLNPRKIAWTKIARQLRGKELAVFDGLERRVHVPVIYSRDVVAAAVDAIPRIAAVRSAQGDAFIRDRILAAKEEQKSRDLAFIEKHERLLTHTGGAQAALRVAKKKQKDAELN